MPAEEGIAETTDQVNRCLHGHLRGRLLTVDMARPRQERGGRGGASGGRERSGSRGGYGGNRY